MQNLNVVVALGIVRVQYRSFIGTGAKRSPAKPGPLRSLGNAQMNCGFLHAQFLHQDQYFNKKIDPETSSG